MRIHYNVPGKKRKELAQTIAQNKHPWKAEVTEGDSAVAADIITNWYQEVYEPSYATEAAE